MQTYYDRTVLQVPGHVPITVKHDPASGLSFLHCWAPGEATKAALHLAKGCVTDELSQNLTHL